MIGIIASASSVTLLPLLAAYAIYSAHGEDESELYSLGQERCKTLRDVGCEIEDLELKVCEGSAYDKGFEDAFLEMVKESEEEVDFKHSYF